MEDFTNGIDFLLMVQQTNGILLYAETYQKDIAYLEAQIRFDVMNRFEVETMNKKQN